MKNIANAWNHFDKTHAVLNPLIPAGAPVAVFDFPNHANVGDSAIWLGQIQYLKQNRSKIVHVDDCYVVDRGFPRLPQEVIILITGGGNLGDLYPRHQKLREKLVIAYPKNRIVQLPQSIFFREKKNQEACRAILNAHEDFHLVVRDRVSLQQGSELVDGPVYLCPDMALCCKSLPKHQEPSHPVVGLLREDKEGQYDAAPISPGFLACDWLEEPPRLKRTVNNITRFDRRLQDRSSAMRELAYKYAASQRVRRGCGILSSGRAVITDRLHAHILCTMLGIPHVVLDNNYRKIKNFRDAWKTGEGICQEASSIKQALLLAKSLVAV